MLERIKKLFRSNPERTMILEKEFESILTSDNGISIDTEDAVNIPAVATSVEFISNTIAGLPVRLFEMKNGEVTELEEDYRLKLLNSETGDLIDAFQWKKNLIRDYLLEGNGYSYINKKRNKIVSLNYIEPQYVTMNQNNDPIFKEADFMIGARKYREFEVLRLLRNTVDGVTGQGVVEEHPLLLKTMYNALKYENNAISYGTKRGFLKSKYKLADEALNALKDAWKKLYSTEANNRPDVMILNDGIEFEPASSTAVENQMNESKLSNSDLVYNIFGLSSALFASANSANVDNEVYRTCIKMAITPIVKALTVTLNKFLLLESEKNSLFFMVDMSEILKVSLAEQYQAYDIGIKGGWLQVDEVRKKENMTPLGLDFVKLSLADVLYYPEKKEIYTANTNTTYIVGKGNGNSTEPNPNVNEGGEENEN
mgnify:CR=1 FL=1